MNEMGDKKYYVSFTREEITHVQMSMELLEQDYLKLKAMKTDAEIEAFIHTKQEEVSYSPGNVDTFYEWNSGKECVDGEGPRGLFDFSIEEWKVISPSGSRKQNETSIGGLDEDEEEYPPEQSREDIARDENASIDRQERR